MADGLKHGKRRVSQSRLELLAFPACGLASLAKALAAWQKRGITPSSQLGDAGSVSRPSCLEGYISRLNHAVFVMVVSAVCTATGRTAGDSCRSQPHQVAQKGLVSSDWRFIG